MTADVVGMDVSARNSRRGNFPQQFSLICDSPTFVCVSVHRLRARQRRSMAPPTLFWAPDRSTSRSLMSGSDTRCLFLSRFSQTTVPAGPKRTLFLFFQPQLHYIYTEKLPRGGGRCMKLHHFSNRGPYGPASTTGTEWSFNLKIHSTGCAEHPV